MLIALNDIEDVYKKRVAKALESEEMTLALLVELSSILYKDVKIENLSSAAYSDSDMSLYEYGTWNWYNEFGEHFSIGISRQFVIPTQDEPYQLHFNLIYEPGQFYELGSYNCWSADFADFDDFIAHIKTTDGFKFADKIRPKTYQLFFEQV